jgi:DnaJ-class molecular chaperone
MVALILGVALPTTVQAGWLKKAGKFVLEAISNDDDDSTPTPPPPPPPETKRKPTTKTADRKPAGATEIKPEPEKKPERKPVKCPECKGAGKYLGKCPRCRGTGRLNFAESVDSMSEGGISGEPEQGKCPDCNGGYGTFKCRMCGGKGTL